MRQLKSLLKALWPESGGNILPLAAVGMLIAAMVVGSAIDFARSYRTQNQLQAACDAAVLAGRKTVSTNGYDTASSTTADQYFAANYDDAVQNTRNTVFTSSSPDNGSTVNGTATSVMNTDVVKVFGYTSFNLRATCTSSMGVGNSDVMMVLDTTGSMGSALGTTTRIAALRTAMKNFYTTIATATSGGNARIRYGFVPYSTTVNVGNLLYNLNPSYLTDSHTYQTRAWVTSAPSTTYSTATSSSWTKYNNTSYSAEANCTAALPANDPDFADYGNASNPSNSTSSGVTTTTTTQQQRKYSYECQSVTSGKGKNQTTVWYIYYMYETRTETTTTTSNWSYGPLPFDTSDFKAGRSVSKNVGSYGAAVAATWNGCIEERGTSASSTFSYNVVTGYSPSNAYDINIDMAPTSDDATKWAPMWPEVSFRRTDAYGNYTLQSSMYGSNTTDYCPAAAQGLQSMTQTAFNAYADSLVATGNTYLDVGLVWGGRMLSPDGIFADTVNAAPSNGGEVARHIIFMTDGIMEPNYSIYSAWGTEWWDRRVTNDGSSNDAARHTQRFRAVCDAIKAKGIRIWVIAFTSGLSSDLSYCASANSAYTATDASGLNTAFQTIAKEVGELRVTL